MIWRVNMAMFPVKTEARSAVTIAILAKAPIPGLAKTRLIPRLGAEGAAALQHWLLQRAVQTAMQAGIGPLSLWCTPDIQHPAFAVYSDSARISLHQQPEGDLGQRMHRAISASSQATIVIGTDCPMLTPELLRQAANALKEYDAVVIPAEDGGYVLIGLRQANQTIFRGIDWSTDQVMAQSRQRLAESALQWLELPPLWDVDHAQDFERLQISLPNELPAGIGRDTQQ